MKEQNQELRKIKKLVKITAKKLIISPFVLKLDKRDEYLTEVYRRLLYFWINQTTGGILQKRKKKFLNEVYKQLFTSQKKNSIIKLGNNFSIIKTGRQALISS